MKDILSARLESRAFAADAVELYELTGREVISQLFEFQLHVVCKSPEGLDEEALLAEPAALVFLRGDREERRLFGEIAVVRDALLTEAAHTAYTLTFVPRAFRMTLTETSEIFMDLSVPEILKKKLERAGLCEGDDFELRLVGSYPPREYVVQYRETDLQFASRLAEHLGISFFFEHRDGRDVIVFADANSGFRPIPGGGRAHFYPRGEHAGVHRLEGTTRKVPSRYVVKDYNYRTPHVPLMAAATVSDTAGGGIVEYGAHFKTPDEGERIAAIRAEELRAGRKVFEGASDVQALGAGARFTLEGHPRGDIELLLVEVRHRLQQATMNMGTGGEHAYTNELRAIPFSTTYRPPRVTPKPRVHGAITGVIDAAEKGQYAEIDDAGRYRVRFQFDTSGAEDGKASRLVRMAQPHAGAGYGFHFPLRSGVEVILTCIDGDPDRPIITGAVPNPQTPSTVGAKNGRRNVIRTGGGNEINIDDTEGEERIKLATPFGGATFQLGSPNTPEAGAALTTSEAWTAVANAGVSTLTSVNTVVSDIASILTAGNSVNHAGLASSVFNALKGEKGQKLIDGLLGIAKSALDIPAKLDSLEQARLDEDAVKAQARADEIERSMARRWSDESLRAAPKVATADGTARPMTRQEWEALYYPEDLQRAEKATLDAKRAKQIADGHKKQITEGDDAIARRESLNTIENAKTASAGIKGVVDLYSSNVKILQRSAEHAAVAVAKTMATAAGGFASAGRIPGIITAPGSPLNLNSATVTSAIVGDVDAFVCGGVTATLSSGGQAIVAGGGAAMLKSPAAVEIAGSGSTLITSNELVDLLSHVAVKLTSGHLMSIKSGKVVDIDAGTRLEMKSGGPLIAEARGAANIKSGGAMALQSSDTLTANAAGSMKLTAASNAQMDGKTLTVKGGDWGMEAGSGKVTVGRDGVGLTVSSGDARIAKGGSACTVKSGSVELKSGGAKLTCGSGTIKLSGRIELG
ncbi:type VI secretion system tip protein TssI/VgrG [Sorangium sp. So ce1335]|uniref:type VI secretion system Vgr family protein n=1 Tax=Sorangium sp. So ce1335 TaxID=3133335 RepID=UPI003F60AF49